MAGWPTSRTLRGTLAVALACLLFGLAVAGAFHDHGSPFGCRSTPHLHAVDPLQDSCTVCHLPRLPDPTSESSQASTSLLPDRGAAPALVLLAPALILVGDRPARAPPSTFPRAS